MKRIIITLSVAFLFFAYASDTHAQVVCQPIYGGGITCPQSSALRINKVIFKDAKAFDSLDNTNPFGPDTEITFQVTITNTGNVPIQQITVRDIIPQFVNFVAGPGNFDASNKVLTFEIINLNPNESRDNTIRVKTVSASSLPKDQSVTCVVNQATATKDSQSSQDNAQFCIQKQMTQQVTPQRIGGVSGQKGVAGAQVPSTTKGGTKIFPQPQVTTTPSTGPEMLPLIGLIPSAALGFFLRKKTQ